MKFFLYLPLFFAFICVEMAAEEYVGVDFVEEKAVRYEGAVSVYVSYPSPGYGEWMNPGCGFMTTHGVRFNKIDFFLGASVGVDLQIPWFPVPALVAGIQPKYYFVDRSKTEFFVLVEGGYIIDGYGSDAGYVKDVTIAHNEVSYVNYSGICVGWGWTLLESGMKNNRIEANYVHHFARRLYDAGGLYTLSYQPGSVMKNNRIENLIDAPYATNDRAFYIYFDEATDGYTVENNWCPEKRFDSNQPGPHNVWKLNGPDVSKKIRQSAGIQKRK